MFILLVVLVLFPIMYISLFSYVWIPESPRIWERAADSVYHLSHLFINFTSRCHFFPLGYYGRSLRSDCIRSSSLPSSVFMATSADRKTVIIVLI